MKLGDIGARTIVNCLRLPQNRLLGELCLGDNGIGDTGARLLSEFLETPASVLRRLSLRDNRIGDAGANFLAAALTKNTKLEELDLWGNLISDAAKIGVLSASKCEVYVELDYHVQLSREPLSQASIKVRAVMVEWLSHMHDCVRLPLSRQPVPDPQNLLFRTFCCVDMYLARCSTPTVDVQLAGVACTLLATVLTSNTSFEEGELATWLSFATDDAYTADEIRHFATFLHADLGLSKLWQPTAYTFLRRYLRKTGWTEESFSLANFLLELSAVDCLSLEYGVQAIAAAAAVISFEYFGTGTGGRPRLNWRSKLIRSVGVDVEGELAPCIAAMARLHSSSYEAVRYCNLKYEDIRLCSVAQIKPNPPKDLSYYIEFLQH